MISSVNIPHRIFISPHIISNTVILRGASSHIYLQHTDAELLLRARTKLFNIWTLFMFYWGSVKAVSPNLVLYCSSDTHEEESRSSAEWFETYPISIVPCPRPSDTGMRWNPDDAIQLANLVLLIRNIILIFIISWAPKNRRHCTIGKYFLKIPACKSIL